ncbi:hypothetical protein [Methanohalophilus mahii]|uniref:Uncharacterized protein n=1 Tax=Methanohalophilus mahii (strain ATCC 35705 / DSM 5219 / SLP) TaxID=547558 RepID=D5EBM0_METMS|nr:hypothetical protein [Methanohalophilus mahii]ADE36571.1 hypothetical protein Mmah_1060 [Methanohalophilus mahii DSM 5219]
MPEENKRRTAFIIAIIVGFLDILILYLGTIRPAHIGWAVASTGIITFLGTLMLINHLSKSTDFDKGEVRKAMTGSFIVVYFSLVSLLTLTDIGISDTELAKTIIAHFTYLVGIVVVFYFGSRAVENYLDLPQKPEK